MRQVLEKSFLLHGILRPALRGCRATPAELAAVRIYEATTKDRRTVLQAVDSALGT